MTQARHSVDSLLVTGQPEPVAPVAPEPQKVEAEAPKVELTEPTKPTSEPETPKSEPATDEFGTETPKVEPVHAESETDEYGNAIPKPRTYTEEEVQRMIRDRLSRGAAAQQQPQPTPQQTQAVAQGFEYDANSEDSWQQQLDTFVRGTVQRMNQEQQENQRKAQEQAVTQAFESKFHMGMSKYPDFQQTLADKPVTDAMMYGIRGLDNPASFLYAAAKQQPGELERISKIPDPYQQVAEMGRLHERMRVKKHASSNAPRPMSPASGDIADAAPYKRSIDQMIAEHAKERVRK